jgi:hypothetical protein
MARHHARFISTGKSIGKASLGRAIRLGDLLLGGIRDCCQLRRISGESHGGHPLLDNLRLGLGKPYNFQPISSSGLKIADLEMK